MVNRCGFYTDGTNVIAKSCSIEWNLGFDKKAKLKYVEQVKAALPKELNPMLEVTSASDSIMGKSLSPIFIVAGMTCLSIDDLVKRRPELAAPGYFDFLYLNCLSDAQWDTIRDKYCFIDVFHDPRKGRKTQASACAYGKLLLLQNRRALLKDREAFIDWYNQVPYYSI